MSQLAVFPRARVQPYTRPAEEVTTPLVIEMTRRTPECASPFFYPPAYVHRDREPRLMRVGLLCIVPLVSRA